MEHFDFIYVGPILQESLFFVIFERPANQKLAFPDKGRFFRS